MSTVDQRTRKLESKMPASSRNIFSGTVFCQNGSLYQPRFTAKTILKNRNIRIAFVTLIQENIIEVQYIGQKERYIYFAVSKDTQNGFSNKLTLIQERGRKGVHSIQTSEMATPATACSISMGNCWKIQFEVISSIRHENFSVRPRYPSQSPLHPTIGPCISLCL